MKKIKNTKSESEQLSDLMDLAIGYQRARVLFTFADFGIGDLLAGKSLTANALAKKLKIDTVACEKFLNAAVTVGLLERKENLYSNTRLTETFLLKNREFYLGGQIKRYGERSYPLWQDLTESLKSWKHDEKSNDVPEDDDQGAEAMAEQHNLSYLHGTVLAKAFDFSKYQRILDLGGGTGAMSIALCKAYPHLEAIVYDLEQNIKTAKKFVKKEKLSARIKCVAGNFQEDELPENFDAVLLANFMSVADKRDNLKILSQIYKKLPKGGLCLLSGLIMDDSKLVPAASVLFCLEDICQNAPDVEKAESVYKGWLKQTGFTNIKSKTYLEPTKMLYGFKK